jgi:hypothetical protein
VTALWIGHFELAVVIVPSFSRFWLSGTAYVAFCVHLKDADWVTRRRDGLIVPFCLQLLESIKEHTDGGNAA